MRARGFTLIEMMAVIVIIALLATAAALSFSQPLAAARARDAVSQVQTLDISARQFARRWGRTVQIVLDLSNRTLARREHDVNTFVTSLPSGCRVDEVRMSSRRESVGE